MTVPDSPSDKKQENTLLDERLLTTPSVAVGRAMLTGGDMAEICRTSLLQAMSTTRVWNDAIADEVLRKEDAVDHYEDVLGTYLVKLSAKHLSVEDNRSVNTLLHTIGDFERVSDHAVNIIKTAREIRDKDIKFSEEALNDLSVLEAAVQDIVNRTVDAFQKCDTYAAGKIEPLGAGRGRSGTRGQDPPHRTSAGRCLHDRVRLCAGRSFDELRAHRRPLLEHCGGHDRGRGGQVRHPRISCQRQARRQREV